MYRIEGYVQWNWVILPRRCYHLSVMSRRRISFRERVRAPHRPITYGDFLARRADASATSVHAPQVETHEATEPRIPANIYTMCSISIPVFSECGATACPPLKLKYCCGALRLTISNEACDKYDAPQGHTLRPILADNFPFSAYKGSQLRLRPLAHIGLCFRQASPWYHGTLHLKFVLHDTRIRNQRSLSMCISELRKLGMKLDLPAN